MDERALTGETEQKRETDSVAQVHKLLADLEELEAKTQRILRLLEGSAEGDEFSRSSGLSEMATLLSLPDHLRQTLMVAQKLGMATSEDVAKRTRRAKSLESSYLNQLTRAGFLKKQRLGRKVYFSIQ